MSSTTSVCPSCGNPVAPDAAFCGNCGAPLQQHPGFYAAADLNGTSERSAPSGSSAPAGGNSGYSAGSYSAVPPVYQPPTPPSPPAAFGSRRIHEVLGSGCSLCLAILNTIPILGVVFVLFQLMMGQFSYSFLDSFFYAAPRLTTASFAAPLYLDPGTLLYVVSTFLTILMLINSIPSILTCIAYWSCYACGRSGKRSTGGLTIFSGLFIYNIVLFGLLAAVIGISEIGSLVGQFMLLDYFNDTAGLTIGATLLLMLLTALIFSLIFKYFIQFRKTAVSIRSILQKGSGRAYVGTFSLVMLYIKAILLCIGVLVLFVLVIAGADLLDLSPVAALLVLTVVLLPSMLSAIVPIVLLHRLQTNGGLWIA